MMYSDLGLIATKSARSARKFRGFSYRSWDGAWVDKEACLKEGLGRSIERVLKAGIAEFERRYSCI